MNGRKSFSIDSILFSGNREQLKTPESGECARLKQEESYINHSEMFQLNSIPECLRIQQYQNNSASEYTERMPLHYRNIPLSRHLSTASPTYRNITVLEYLNPPSEAEPSLASGSSSPRGISPETSNSGGSLDCAGVSSATRSVDDQCTSPESSPFRNVRFGYPMPIGLSGAGALTRVGFMPPHHLPVSGMLAALHLGRCANDAAAVAAGATESPVLSGISAMQPMASASSSGSGIQMVAGSAFHAPVASSHQQMMRLQAAHATQIQLLARSGVCLPRILDYNGRTF